MEWLVAAILFLVAIGFLALTEGGWYAAGIAGFLILVAVVSTLVARLYGEMGALVFSLIALVFAFWFNWRFRKNPKA